MALFNVTVPEGQLARQSMQKAYIQFSTASWISSDEKKHVQKSHWNYQVDHELKQHEQILIKLLHGERVQGIEKDPLESADVDFVVDISNIAGYLKRETSTIGDDKLRIPVPEN